MADTLPFLQGWQASQQITDAGQENKLRKLLLDQKTQEVEQTNALNNLYRNSIGADGAIDRQKLLTGAAQGGLGTQIPGLQKSFLEQDKAKREAQKAALEQHMQTTEIASRVLNGVKDQAGLDQARSYLATISPEGAATLPATYDQATIGAIVQRGMALKDQIDQEYKRLTAGETQRHNQAMEGNAAGALKVSQDRLAYDQNAPKGQVVQGENGPVLVDPRTGTGRAITTADGQPLGKPLKDIPPTVNNAILQNQQTTNQLQKAIDLLEGKDVGGAKGDKNATGWKGYLPGAVLNRVDPSGVDTRAEIADIGSLKIHDRSGAAVTLSEAPRLMPFIPLNTDDQATVLKKLRRLKQEADNESAGLNEIYSKEQGYKPAPKLPGNPAPTKPGGSAPPAGAIAHLKANPNLRAQFDAKYGAGMAASVLGN